MMDYYSFAAKKNPNPIMADKTIMVAAWGGPGGQAWDMGRVVASTHLTNIRIRHGYAVDAIQYSYVVNGVATWSPQRGGTGGVLSEINFESEEYLKGIKGYCGVQCGFTVIKSITFISNKRQYGSYGKQEGTPFSFSMSNGKIVGFHGHSGWFVDAIGFYVVPV